MRRKPVMTPTDLSSIYHSKSKAPTQDTEGMVLMSFTCEKL